MYVCVCMCVAQKGSVLTVTLYSIKMCCILFSFLLNYLLIFSQLNRYCINILNCE